MTAAPASAPNRERARVSFLRACRLDVQVRKPGNVSVFSPGHGMEAQLFLASAQAAARPLFTPGDGVGARIEAAVRATAAVAGCNTNLGILLLCAPLAVAVERHPAEHSAASLQAAVEQVLQRLDRDDAACAYRAIASARPGGLGVAAEQDVHRPPDVDLRAAMALAADRDNIAKEYRDGYSLVFGTGLPALRGVLNRSTPASAPAWHDDAALLAPPAADVTAAVQLAYLALLAGTPDSHILRKHGGASAERVRCEAQAWHQRALAGAVLDDDPAFAVWDAALKAAGLNPGTTADLLVASVMAAGLTD